MANTRVVGRVPLQFLYVTEFGTLTWTIIIFLELLKYLIPFFIILGMYGSNYEKFPKSKFYSSQITHNMEYILDIDYNNSVMNTNSLALIKNATNKDPIILKTEENKIIPYESTITFENYYEEKTSNLNEIDIKIYVTSIDSESKKFGIMFAMPLSFKIKEKESPIETLVQFYYQVDDFTSKIFHGSFVQLTSQTYTSNNSARSRFRNYFSNLLSKYNTNPQNIFDLENFFGIAIKNDEYFSKNIVETNSNLEINLKLTLLSFNETVPLDKKIFEIWKDYLLLFIPFWVILSYLQWILVKYGILCSSKVTNYTRRLPENVESIS